MLTTGEQDDILTARSRQTSLHAVATHAMIRDFAGDTTTPRRRAKELCYELLVAFSKEWQDCLDEKTDAPLCEGNTEREKGEVSSQLLRIIQQFSKYHKI